VKLIYTVIAISVLLFSLFHSSVFAAMSLDIKSGPEKINLDEEAEIEVAFISTQKKTTYYLQTAFTVSGKTEYFGYTQKNDGSWHKYNESFDNFYQITTNEEGSWSGKLKGKPDIEDKDFKGSGNYLVKIGRYTSSGKSHDWSDNSWDIEIIGPPATVTPTKIPTVKPTVKPTHTPKPLPTEKPTQKTVATATVTTAPSKAISQVITNIIVNNEKETTVAGRENDKVLGSESTSAASYRGATSRLPIIILVLSGLIFIGGGVFISIKKINKNSGKSDLFP